jgi:hypothetical protein
MKKFIILPYLLALCFLSAQEKNLPPEMNQTKEKSSIPILPPNSFAKEQRSIMVIPPKERALDYVKAFELLKLEKPSAKIFFQLSSNKIINNIIDIALLDNGTLLLFKIATTQGTKLVIVPIEDIQEISHQ